MIARKVAVLLVLFVFLWVAGCKPQATPLPPVPTEIVVDLGLPGVVIVSPPSESSFPAQSRVMIHSTATDAGTGISRVDLFANGVLVRSDKTPEDTPQEQYSLLQAWVPSQPGSYVLTVMAYRSDGTPSTPAMINLTVTDEEAEPVVEEEQPCMVMASTRINIRSGPDTTYGIMGILPLGETVPVNGRNADTTWWRIEYDSLIGWVFAELTYPEGDCEDIPVAEAGQPGASGTEGTEAIPADPSSPDETPETAPADTDFNPPLIIPLNQTASVSDQVSYPDGDRVDKVQYDVSGLQAGATARLLITAVCAGTGMEFVTFSTGGQTFGCAQTIVNRDVTTSNKSGTITIEATGGSATSVFWVLTGTATNIPALPLP
jgi:uncharacterized protein YraI